MFGKMNSELVRMIESVGSNVSKMGEKIKELDDYDSGTTKAIDYFNKEFLHYREDCNNRIKKLNNLIDEKLDIQKENTESLLIGLTKTFENKINNLSGGKTIVTDLLQKIVKLEALKDAVEHRRSSQEILDKYQELHMEFLKSDREGNPNDFIKNQLEILKWVLGE